MILAIIIDKYISFDKIIMIDICYINNLPIWFIENQASCQGKM
jgi:hypothetical protein